jgi:hypothetical protein
MPLCGGTRTVQRKLVLLYVGIEALALLVRVARDRARAIHDIVVWVPRANIRETEVTVHAARLHS